ncbi:MAG TPA: hypothetical protein VFS43_44615 [Polyangiaceae bacterium]|nr:hypothetical protein [Polyangiaceae bacterium]
MRWCKRAGGGRFGGGAGAAGVGALLAAALWVGPARAEPTSPSGKGIVGGALLGGEAVMAVEAAIGVQNGWAYLIGGVLGAGAGGVGGYIIEQEASPRVSLYMLAGGMALVVPTTIAVLSATQYRPPPEYQEDAAPRGTQPSSAVPRPNEPSTVPGSAPSSSSSGAAPTGSARAPEPRHRALALAPRRPPLPPTSMVDVSPSGLRLGVPAIELRPVFSPQELRQYGMAQRDEVRVPVFRATF